MILSCKYNDTYKNTASRPASQVAEDNYMINVITDHDKSLKEPHEIAFVVSKKRKHSDYVQVLAQTVRCQMRAGEWGSAVREYFAR